MKRGIVLLLCAWFLNFAEGSAQNNSPYDLGLAAYNRKDYATAIRYFSQSIDLYPNDPNGFICRGDSYSLSGEPDKGIEDLTKALDMNLSKDALVMAYVDRSSAYADKKMWKEEIADCQSAISADTNSEPAYSNLVGAYLNTGDFDLGLDAAKKALALDPNDRITLQFLVRIYLHKKDYQDAHDTFLNLINLTPSGPNNLNGAAWLLATCPDASCRDGKKAVELATKACDVTNWKVSATIDTLAAAYAETGDFPNAIKYEQQYLASPDLDMQQKEDGNKRLALYQANQPYRDTK